MAVRAIDLRSDNCGGVAEDVLQALVSANAGTAAAYGADEWSAALTALVRELFDHPEAEVFPVPTGTAANAVGLSALCPPWGAILCHETAHIVVNECGASSMFAGGAVMRGLRGEGFRLHADGVRAVLESAGWGDPHQSQPAVLSLTQPTDFGTLYSVADVTSLSAAARAWKLRVQMDGARFANALAALGCAPADLSWKAGVEVLTIGATKGGVMSTDAIVCFDPKVAHDLRFRTKRAGHVASKMRFQAAQLIAWLADGRWLRLAARANAAMARLTAGVSALELTGVNSPDVNMLFVRMPDDVARRLEEANVLFYRIESGLVRFVTSFQTTDADVDEVLDRLRDAI